jgi:hypothetical protein
LTLIDSTERSQWHSLMNHRIINVLFNKVCTNESHSIWKWHFVIAIHSKLKCFIHKRKTRSFAYDKAFSYSTPAQPPFGTNSRVIYFKCLSYIFKWMICNSNFSQRKGVWNNEKHRRNVSTNYGQDTER